MPSNLLTLLLLAACGDDDDCPTGFLRDNDGNCVQVGETAPTLGTESDTDTDTDTGTDTDTDTTAPTDPGDCYVTLDVSSNCTRCTDDGFRFQVSNEDSDDGFSVNVGSGRSESDRVDPGVVRVELNVIGIALNLPADCWDTEYADYGFVSPANLSTSFEEVCQDGDELTIAISCPD